MISELSRYYPSVWSRPVLRAVDTEIFRLRYFQRCLACDFCGDQCCDHGVDIDQANAERLLALGDDFQSRVGISREGWFTKESVPDEEFPSRRHLRTQVRNGKCVFHGAQGRGCTIHAWCIDNKVDYHTLKPMVSVLFPLTFEHGVLVPSNEMKDGTLVCGGRGETLYDGVRDELAWYFGGAFVRELDDLRAWLTSQ